MPREVVAAKASRPPTGSVPLTAMPTARPKCPINLLSQRRRSCAAHRTRQRAAHVDPKPVADQGSQVTGWRVRCVNEFRVHKTGVVPLEPYARKTVQAPDLYQP
jgi:hypothetical protein